MTEAQTVKCIRCGREFRTTTVEIFRYSFPGSRFCEVCRETEVAEDQEKRAEILFTQAQIPVMYRSVSLSSYDTSVGSRHAHDVVSRWSAEVRRGSKPPRGLLLHGPTGAVKTHLAISVIREAIYSRFMRCLFINVPEWLNAVREAWNASDAAAPPNPDGYELAVIDDLGAENTTRWAQERIYGLVNHRAQSGGLTVITTNLEPADIRPRLGGPTASRITELCASVPVDARDFRELRAAAG